jgi:ubiquinone biosynthesis accessory factor UbiJ
VEHVLDDVPDTKPEILADEDGATVARRPPVDGGAAYNRVMLHSLQEMLAPAVLERMTLVLNHVLGSEAVATDRLRPHAGRTLELQLAGWPALLPRPPALAWRVTPAGLLEWCGTVRGPTSDLTMNLDAANPALLLARMVAGEPPAVQIDGDAQLAGDVNWLITNLRWDVAADLERLFGPVVGQQLHRLGSALAGALRGALGGALSGAGRLSERWRRPTA